MNQQQIQQKAREYSKTQPSDGFSIIYAKDGYIAGYNDCALDSQNQIDKLVEGLRELYTSYAGLLDEIDPKGFSTDFRGNRFAIERARTLLATFTNKNLEDEKEK